MATQPKQPQSLEELYNQVGAEHTATLKQAATELRRAEKLNVAVILQAHALLAGIGRDGMFKQWCDWNQISYGAARWQVWAAKNRAKEEALGTNTSRRKGNGKGKSNKGKQDQRSEYSFTFDYGEDKDTFELVDDALHHIMERDDITKLEALRRMVLAYDTPHTAEGEVVA